MSIVYLPARTIAGISNSGIIELSNPNKIAMTIDTLIAIYKYIINLTGI